MGWGSRIGHRTSRVVQWLDGHNGLVSAVASVVIVVLTISLAFYAGGQLTVMRGQLDEMRAEQRPWVGVDGVHVEPLKAGQPIIASVRVKNVGRSPAFKIRAGFGGQPYAASEIVLLPANCSNCTTDVLFPDGVKEFSPFDARKPLTDGQLADIAAGKLIVRLGGRIEYVDSQGTPHKTLVCMFYRTNAPGVGAFALGGPEGDCNTAD